MLAQKINLLASAKRRLGKSVLKLAEWYVGFVLFTFIPLMILEVANAERAVPAGLVG